MQAGQAPHCHQVSDGCRIAAATAMMRTEQPAPALSRLRESCMQKRSECCEVGSQELLPKHWLHCLIVMPCAALDCNRRSAASAPIRGSASRNKDLRLSLCLCYDGGGGGGGGGGRGPVGASQVMRQVSTYPAPTEPPVPLENRISSPVTRILCVVSLGGRQGLVRNADAGLESRADKHPQLPLGLRCSQGSSELLRPVLTAQQVTSSHGPPGAGSNCHQEQPTTPPGWRHVKAWATGLRQTWWVQTAQGAMLWGRASCPQRCRSAACWRRSSTELLLRQLLLLQPGLLLPHFMRQQHGGPRDK